MNPDVVAAIENLRNGGTLSEVRARALLRPARGELVSVHAELRALLYLGVLVATSGVGLFLKEYHDRLGPVVLASLLAAAAAACLAYVVRRAAPFSWEADASPHIAVDYVLLLGALLLASDLAYVETQFRWLGAQWPLHLLIVSILCGLLAYRFDSRILLSLALSSFAAWRGVSASRALRFVPYESVGALRANAIGCGLLFLAAGVLSVRLRRKAHFEAVYVTLGLLLLFAGLLSGVFRDSFQDAHAWAVWEMPLFVCAGVVIAVAHRLRRPLDFALSVLAAYLGVLRILSEVLSGSALAFTIAVSSLAVLAFLIRVQHRLREDRP